MMIVHFVYDVCSVLVQLDIFFHGDKFLFLFVTVTAQVAVALCWVEPVACFADCSDVASALVTCHSFIC